MYVSVVWVWEMHKQGVCVISPSPFPPLYSSPLPLVVEEVARENTNLRPSLAPCIVSCTRRKTTQRRLPPTPQPPPQPPPQAMAHSPLAGTVYWSLLSYTSYCVVHTHTHTHTHTHNYKYSASSKHKSLKHMRSFSKLFRRKGSGHKKNLARRASAPVPRFGKM